MTVGELKDWLSQLTEKSGLALPDGLPDALGDLKDAVNIGALEKWFTVSAELTVTETDPANLRLSGTISPATPTVSLWFFAENDKPADGDDVIGVQIALSLSGNPLLGALTDIGLHDPLLVYEIRMLDGAAVRKLYAQADIELSDGDALTLTCSADFEADRTSYDFVIEPEEGKQLHIAEAFFGLFGVTPPPVLKGIELERLVLGYDRGATSGFRVEVDAAVPLGDVTADFGVQATLTKRTGEGEAGYDQEYTAYLSLTLPAPEGTDPRVLTFTVEDAQHADFSATWEDSEDVTLAGLAALLGVKDDAAADVLDRLGSVNKLVFGYSAARKAIVLAAGGDQDKGADSLVVVSDKPVATEPRAWAVRVGVALEAMLSQVPLLHGQIPDGQDAGLRGLGVLIASQDLTADRIGELNKALSASGDGTLPALPADGLVKGLAFLVDLQLPGRSGTTSLVVRGGTGGTKTPPSPQAPQQPQTPRLIREDGSPVEDRGPATPAAAGLPLVAWADVQRSVGPLRLRRIGAGLAGETVWVLFDASLGMAGLELGVEGLGVGVSLKDGSLHVRLDGISVAYSRPPLAIAGGLVYKPDDPTYDPLVEGVLAVSAEKFGITALGAYARDKKDGEPSMFLFGKVTGEFGGPPPVQITEIMAGFGFNTDLRLPEGDEVLQFPFLKDMTAPEPSADSDPMAVLETLMGSGDDAWVRPRPGQLWFAAGLGFKVFEFLEGQALLVLEVGDDFAVAVLGTAEARFPKDVDLKAYARARLGISAQYRQSERTLKIAAQLAPGSFLIDEACVLTGGFALYTWFDDAHAGDFVLTLGGYHPDFPVPAHYPTVPRLGFNWPVTSELTISGGSYFALTPGAVMAGGELDVNFRSGDLHAWLKAGANMLIEWAPFHFDVGIEVSIGVSFVLDLWLVRETISVEVGASLRLWGPPTAGEVTVHLWFISFTISFGDGSAKDGRAATWDEVLKQLPAPPDAVRLMPTAGLSPTRAKDAQGEELWVVGPGAFSFAVRTAVPVSELRLGTDKGAKTVTGHKVDIRPRRGDGMGLDSVLTVTLTKDNGTDQPDLGAWYAGPAAENRASLPAALWGSYEGDLSATGPQRVGDQLMGVDLRLPPPAEGDTPGPIKAGVLAHDDRRPDGTLPLHAPVEAPPVEAPLVAVELFAEPVRGPRDMGGATGAMSGTLIDQSRDRLFAAMGYLGVSPGTNGRLAADDTLVAGDVTAPIADTVPGEPTVSERLYVLGAGKTVTPVDAQGLTPYAPIALQHEDPTHMAVSPDGSRMYVVGRPEHIDVFDTSADRPDKAVALDASSFALAQNARGAAYSPDGKWAYATYPQPNQMVILDLSGEAAKRVHEYGTITPDWRQAIPAEVAAALSRDGKPLAYIALPDEGTVVKVDVSSVANPTPLAWLTAGPSPTRLAVDPKGRWVYALNAGRSTVTVVDVTAATGDSAAVVTTLRTGTDPSALVASPDGTRLYVASATAGTVSVFDTSGAAGVSGDKPVEAGEPVWVGPQPVALAVSTAGDRLYVALAKDRKLRVVDVAANPPVLLPDTVPLPDDPLALAVTVPAADNSRTKEGGAA
ncbi:YncE family protein [Streptomyces sp. UNOB3_S3]|uniref:YncE family protein n=1 Tax=Streptomyces sp. UNOB3_S3 TaxID=2871682 RepID=UPI001E3F93F0|nr:YncE family protein [Streptomyces sp. UNOB3_S3]